MASSRDDTRQRQAHKREKLQINEGQQHRQGVSTKERTLLVLLPVVLLLVLAGTSTRPLELLLYCASRTYYV
jgi:hypothetical protein